MQSATVTLRRMPGAVVIQPSMPSTYTQPRPGSDPRPVIPPSTPYCSRQPGISYRGIAPGIRTSASSVAEVGEDWCNRPELLPTRPEGTRPASLLTRPLPIHALDLGSQGAQPFINPLVTTLDLPHIVDSAATFGGQGGEQHRHAGADVRRFDRAAFKRRGTRDHSAVRVAQNNAGP